MIRATLRGTHVKKNRRLQAKSVPYVNIENNAELMNNLKEILERKEEEKCNKSIQEKYCDFVNTLKTEVRKVYTNNKVILSTKTTQLLKERKLLLQDTKNKETRKEIAEISKKIKEQIRKDRKQRRTSTLQYHIKKTGGIKKAFKELELKKHWILNMEDKQGKCSSKRVEILNIATEYYKDLYKSKNGKLTKTTMDDTQDSEPLPPVLKEETERAIITQKLGKAPGPDQITNELLKISMPVIVPKLTNLFNEIIKTENIPEDWTKSQLEYVNEYIYLGQLISPTENMQKEIERRIANTWKKFWSLSEIMNNKEMPMSEKRKVFNSCILPCLTYACQTWALTEQQQNKINICQNGIERSVLGVRRKDKIKLKRIKEKTKFGKVQSVCRKLKWRWTGHMLREKKEKWTRIITEWYPRENRRSRGRQPKRWEDDFKKVAGPEWLRTARDRNKWKALEEAFVERQAVNRGDQPNAENMI
ncbi:unnamed protein product [Parnassius mnemosyne]|uniref:Endonuclease-reverse transcriptase n=1 Tax=Parnassius mnemosyne TaxID=213953 RepID=A0AAV1M2H8_9NEOP